MVYLSRSLSHTHTLSLLVPFWNPILLSLRNLKSAFFNWSHYAEIRYPLWCDLQITAPISRDCPDRIANRPWPIFYARFWSILGTCATVIGWVWGSWPQVNRGPRRQIRRWEKKEMRQSDKRGSGTGGMKKREDFYRLLPVDIYYAVRTVWQVSSQLPKSFLSFFSFSFSLQ